MVCAQKTKAGQLEILRNWLRLITHMLMLQLGESWTRIIPLAVAGKDLVTVIPLTCNIGLRVLFRGSKGAPPLKPSFLPFVVGKTPELWSIHHCLDPPSPLTKSCIQP